MSLFSSRCVWSRQELPAVCPHPHSGGGLPAQQHLLMVSLSCFQVFLEQARTSCCTVTPADGVTLFFQVCLEQARASCCLSSSSFWWRSSSTMTPADGVTLFFQVCLEQARTSCCTMTPADGVTLFFQVCLEQARASCCLSSSSFWWRSSSAMTPTPRGSPFLGNFCCPPPPTWLWTGCCRGEHLASLCAWLL